MQRVVIIVASALFSAAAARAHTLDVLSHRDVRVAMRLREIDRGALAALKQRFTDDHRLADRGASFEVGDAISRFNFPPRRLVLAAASGNTWFIHYEHGGIGHHSHLVALAPSGHTWQVTYAATAFDEYDTLPELRAAIRAHQFGKTYEL